MKINEAKEGLAKAIEDIASLPLKEGFEVKSDCGYSNAEYEKLTEADTPECIFGEITVGVSGAKEAVVFECAVGIFEKNGEAEISDDELAQKIGEVREAVRSFVNEVKQTEADSLAAAFTKVIDEEEEAMKPTAEDKQQKSNTGFYIAAVLAALAAVAFFLCLKYFF